MSTVVSATLAELEARAGASDQDREAWLAERRRGVTATEVRDLHLGKTRVQDLVDFKLGVREDSFQGNAFTQWGKDREPVIADQVVARFGIYPESRVFRAADNPRFLASPDGVGLDFDERLLLSEIKTTGKDITPGSKAYQDTGYELQLQWLMRVTGARQVLFVWEQRLGTPQDGFEPGATRWQWIQFDELLVARLEKTATEFLAELDKQREHGSTVDENLDTLAVNYLRGLSLEKEGTAAKTSAFNAIKEALAGHESFTQTSLLSRITWTRAGTREEEVEVDVIDEEAALAADPELWAKVRRARASAERATARAAALEAEWQAVLAEHTTKDKQVEQRTVREVLRITAPKVKEMAA